MSKKLTDIFANAEVPVVLCVASGENTGSEIAFTKVIDSTSGKKITLLANNASAMKSPLTGEDVTIAENAQLETASFDSKEAMSSFACVANCVACNHDLYVTKDVAEAVDNKAMYCTNCGEKVTAYYDGDLSLADEDPENPDGEDSDGEITDALDEDTDDTDDTGDDDVVEDSSDNPDGNAIGGTGAADTSSDDSDASDDSTDDSDDASDDSADDSDDADSSDDATDTGDDADNADDSGDSTSDDDTSDDAGDAPDGDEEDEDDAVDSEEENAATVVVASVIDFADKALTLASTANADRYEVFIGEHHIGALDKSEAELNVQNIFAKRDVVRNAFGSSFRKNTAAIEKADFASLASYGFKPAKVTVPFAKVVATEVATLEKDFETKTEEAVKTATDQVVATMKIAMAGLDKGTFSGPNLYSEVAKLLTSFGVGKAEEASARFVTDFSAKYFNAVVAKSDDLRKQSPEFVRGLSNAIETAAYSNKVHSGTEDTAFISTSSLLPDVSHTTKPKRQEIRKDPVAPENNRYGSLFKRY